MRSVDRRGGQNAVDADAALEAIADLAGELGQTPTRVEMLEMGEYSETPYRRIFGSWNEAVRAAGLEPHQDGGTFEVECKHCGEIRERLVSQCTNQEHHFCSQGCLHRWRSETFNGTTHPLYERVSVSCDSCGDVIQRIPAVVEDRENHFCDSECYAEWCSTSRVAENHPCWRGGGRYYYGPKWLQKRAERVELDGYRCQECGITQAEHYEEHGRDLSVHHQKPVSEFYDDLSDSEDYPDFEVMNALDNLLTLCFDCHRSTFSTR
jgi:5-methylcytosine-specific restriction endonuclease McrA